MGFNFDLEISGINSTKQKLENAKPETTSYRVTADTDYAVYVEFGTKSQSAQPFMRQAVNQVMRDADSIAESAESTDDLVETLAEEIADEARDNAPVDTGKLRNSIEVREL
jgi:hypothetical protein